MKQLMSGNEAVARGIYEAGVKLCSGYPGTPSTEILETVAARYPGRYAQWSPNEKVAYEVAFGASVGGARAIVTMKHVGLNVAADPFMTNAYTGVNGGLVLVSADDPEMHSSQNEQDNRIFARFAQIPFLDPSDSEEARAWTHEAFKISESFDTPVMLHMTTRISHSKGVVSMIEPITAPDKKFAKDPGKYVMIPSHARERHALLEERLARLKEFAEITALNIFEDNGSEIGIITGGIAYQYVKEVAPHFDFFKIGLGYPLPMNSIGQFIEEHDKVLVVEELEPFWEDMIKAAGLKVSGKEFFGPLGEFSPNRVAEGLHKAGLLSKTMVPVIKPQELFPRPPVLCPGCPHRGAFMALRKLKVAVTGDIGCYTLGVLKPLDAMDTCLCMGASIGSAIGMERVSGSATGTVAVIGDSTFFHSGLTGLVDAVYNNTNVTIMILDNRATAMTGGQNHPGTGRTLMGNPAPELNIEKIVKAIGVKNVRSLDPYHYDEALDVIKEEMSNEGPSVIITSRPCVLMPKRIMDEPYAVISDLCTACAACFRISCPAISASEERVERGLPKALIDQEQCTGCTLCAQVCPEEAIVLKSQLTQAEKVGRL